MKTVTINWAFIGSIVAAIAGIVGTILTPIYGSGLSTTVEAVLMGISGLLILIPTYHAGSVASYTSKMQHAAAFQRANSALDGIPEGFGKLPKP